MGWREMASGGPQVGLGTCFLPIHSGLLAQERSSEGAIRSLIFGASPRFFAVTVAFFPGSTTDFSLERGNARCETQDPGYSASGTILC